MSKELALALFYMGKGYGQKVYEHDIEDDTDCPADMKAAGKLINWASIAVDMVEVAHAFTMDYPEGYEYNVYREFGEWYGERAGNNDNYAPPENDECIDALINLVHSTFEDNLTDEQKKRLIEKLSAVNQ